MSVVINCATIIGLNCQPIAVEADLSSALNNFIIVGLPDQSVAEARERVRQAVRNSALDWPRRKVIVNLAPADLKKFGSYYDLAMAVAILWCSRAIRINPEDAQAYYLGELSLTGDIKPINGVLSIAKTLAEIGAKKIYLPIANVAEASLINGLEIRGANNLAELVAHLQGKEILPVANGGTAAAQETVSYPVDLSDIRGQAQAKRALVIAAAGNHNLLLTGPPGSGKTMLAKSMISLLPPLTREESLAVTNIYSVAGLLPRKHPLLVAAPWRHPHHTASAISLIGGGSHPAPGEITLAHKGVLFLDELPEFPRTVLENLRQPLEDKVVTIARVFGTYEFPADFILLAAMNPCPCGYLSDPDRRCVCSPGSIIKYRNKISGPLLDRIDLFVEVPRLQFAELVQKDDAEKSSHWREIVSQTRQRQRARQQGLLNYQLTSQQTRQYCQLGKEAQLLLEQAINQLNLSPRSYFRLLKIARTIADLACSEEILTEHLAESLQYRLKNN
ncbi:MAG: magnesium chelatase [Candidatus Komeilibacteria bacterium CG_4_10_14_0_2_um_filter_37_10]|uniref:Magnesium chelatase n=1 Tax=Candidatus Komeilibacteria bacterium CG_4_10_14_0_2_um_filter_37_10 TaxID=1974470 RepID=A0A2M7VGI2_9BACT|nr:MAG: magnesium chelatase [Candidatus Komeilibacteria bacterium CG_4_10_14_0_2_um_filter_37_10]PJA92653.1 MAG: magnesium chelatase [Candidatus Komeilibacteria bacterium CG_4_9_14_3_um_filter_37_5]